MKTQTINELTGMLYITPDIKTVEVQTEGLLCTSGETEDYIYGEVEW